MRLLFISYFIAGFLLLAGCGGSSNGSSTAIAFSSVAATNNPQVASYTVVLPRPGNVSIQFGTDTSYGLSTWQRHTNEGTLTANILVAGMKGKTTYHLRAKVEYDNGASATDADYTFTTGAVPNVIPHLQITANSALTAQPGVEMVDPVTPNFYAPFVTDLEGNPLWTYYPPEIQHGKAGELIYPVKLLANGNMMCIIGTNSSNVVSSPPGPGAVNVLREFDLAGNTIREISVADLNTRLAAANFHVTLQVFSHDFVELPNGHVLVIANTVKPFTNLPGYPGTTNVIGDVVVDLDENFNPVWLWNEFDHLDVNRHPMNFPDWTHTNAIAYSPDDGNFLVSIRHQSWIVKVDYRNGAGTGNIIWRLGHAGDFKLLSATHPTDWFYAQHDVNFVSPNTTGSFQIAVMDNGDNRVFPGHITCGTTGAPACYTTIPVIQVDENAKTASFLFHQQLTPDLYSSFAGDTRVQPNTNVEYNLSGLVPASAYIVEVTPTANPQNVWQMYISNANTYRAHRMPSLYPGVQW